MKKLALTNLLLLMAIKSVSACSIGIDPNNPQIDPYAEIAEQAFYTEIYFYSLIFLILANIVLFFLRRQKDYLSLLPIIVLAIGMIPITFVAALIQDCGDLLHLTLKWEFIIFLTVFCLHIGLWINNIGLHWRTGKLNLINLR